MQYKKGKYYISISDEEVRVFKCIEEEIKNEFKNEFLVDIIWYKSTGFVTKKAFQRCRFFMCTPLFVNSREEEMGKKRPTKKDIFLALL